MNEKAAEIDSDNSRINTDSTEINTRRNTATTLASSSSQAVTDAALGQSVKPRINKLTDRPIHSTRPTYTTISIHTSHYWTNHPIWQESSTLFNFILKQAQQRAAADRVF